MCDLSPVTRHLLAPFCTSQYLITTHYECDSAHGHVNPSHAFLDFQIGSLLSTAKQQTKKTLMFPWLPDINLFNFSGGSHGKLLNPAVFSHVLAFELLPTHLHPLNLVLGHLQVLDLLLVLHQRALFMRKSGGTKEVDD